MHLLYISSRQVFYSSQTQQTGPSYLRTDRSVESTGWLRSAGRDRKIQNRKIVWAARIETYIAWQADKLREDKINAYS